MKFYKLFIGALSLFVVLSFVGCGGSGSSNGTGTLSLSLADAPLDEANVTGVYITISGIDYHTAQGEWKTMGDFNTSINPINLLDWQNGASISLGDFQLPAGKYTQMRFVLDAAEDNGTKKSNTGCYIKFTDDTNETLYIPSGDKTGYKVTGNYDVPVNGTVNMTADFDVRKSVVKSGNGSYYKLKPTIKLVVTNEAGRIAGTVRNLDSNSTYVVYAYEYVDSATTWENNETNVKNDIRFPNATASTIVKDDGTYTVAFLAAGTYDLIIAKYGVNGDYQGFDIQPSIVVESGKVAPPVT